MDMLSNSPINITKLRQAELIDYYGSAKAVYAEAKKTCDAYRDEIVRRLSSCSFLDKPAVREGNLFRITVSYSEAERMDTNKVKEDFLNNLDGRKRKKYFYITPQYTVNLVSKTGEKGTK